MPLRLVRTALLAATVLVLTSCGDESASPSAKPYYPYALLDSTVDSVDDACELSLTDRGWDALRTLLVMKNFQRTTTGLGNSLSRGARAWRILFAEPQRDAAFKCLIRNGTLGGQLYGLCGIYYTDTASFHAYAARYRDRTDSIEVWSGCEVFAHQIGRLVALPGHFDLGSRDAIWRAWWAAQSDTFKIYDDITGGTIPSDLRDGVFNTEQPALEEP